MKGKNLTHVVIGISALLSVAIITSIVFANKAKAANYSYAGARYNQSPASLQSCPSTICPQPPGSTCNNGPSAGNSGGCGASCDGGNAWTKYQYSGCYTTSSGSEGDICNAFFQYADNVCSTGDKYNSSNPPVMNYGQCSCAVGTGYKTCCNGTTLANARNYQVDPYDPDEADCGNATTVFCGFGDYPPCGQDACGYATTPTPTPSGTPTPTPTQTPTPTGPTCTQGWNCVSGARACFTNSNCSQGLCIDCPQGSTCTNGACIRNVECVDGETRNICTSNSC